MPSKKRAAQTSSRRSTRDSIRGGASKSKGSKRQTSKKETQAKPIGKPFIAGKKIGAPVKKRISNRASTKQTLPKTAKISRSHKSSDRPAASRAHSGMSLTELQNMAKSRGIPFGGLHAQQLVRKINNYF